MSLQDLVTDNKKISENLLENLLKGYVELVKDGKKVILTKKGMSLPRKTRVLLLLAGGKAWTFLDKKEWSIAPSDMEGVLSIPGGSLRPILKIQADNFLIKRSKGKYQIRPKGLFQLEDMFQDKDKNSGKEIKQTRKIGAKLSGKSKGGSSKAEIISEMMLDGFFDSPKDLKEIQIESRRRATTIKMTSLPPYLLPLVRKKKLFREYKKKDKKKVWVYRMPDKKQV